MKGKWLNIITKISFLLLVIAFSALSIAAKVKREHLQLKAVQVTINHNDGYSFITQKEVKDKLKEIMNDSANYTNIENLKVLKKKVEENPFVKEVDIFVDHNSRINISVNQRKPLFRVVNQQNLSYYVDESGFKFPISKHAFPKVLIVSGYFLDNPAVYGQIESPKMKEIFNWVEYINEEKYWSSMIAQIYNEPTGKTELITRLGNFRVYVDLRQEPKEQLEKLQIFFEEIALTQGIEKYKTINIQYDGQIICSKQTE